jgi:hypothetical protein
MAVATRPGLDRPEPRHDGVSFRAAARRPPGENARGRDTDQETRRTMAKRQRGGARPGQRAPLQKGRPSTPPPASAPAAPVRPAGGLSDDELARAAELEARIVAEEQAATASLTRGRDRRRTAPSTGSPARTRSAALLTATAEEEYRYVMADLRKIGLVFALCFALLVASWLLIVASGVVTI